MCGMGEKSLGHIRLVQLDGLWDRDILRTPYVVSRAVSDVPGKQA